MVGPCFLGRLRLPVHSFPVCTALPSPCTRRGSDALTVLTLPCGAASLGRTPQAPSGPPAFLTPLSTPTTRSGGPRQTLRKRTKTFPRCRLLQRSNPRRLHEPHSRGCITLQGVRSPCRSPWCPGYASPVAFGLHLLHRCHPRSAWLVRPSSAGMCPLQEAPSFAWRTNAGGEPRPKAEARHERKLEGVGSSAWFGAELGREPSTGVPSPTSGL
jgi:hypothetical protein